MFFAHVLGATNIAFGFIAVHFATSTRSLFALDLALWSLAYWVALGRAHWVVTLPSAFRVAFVFCVSVNLHFVGNHGHDHEGEDEEYFAVHFCFRVGRKEEKVTLLYSNYTHTEVKTKM